MMIHRELQFGIERLLQHFPVVAILGPRQIGKTTLAKSIMRTIQREVVYLDMELPSDINRLSNAQLFFENNATRCIIVDEVQRRPDLFPVLRAVIDQQREPGRFIILGSASPELLKQSSESLAGRIVYTELTGLLVSEVEGDSKATDLWLRGGFPEPFMIKDDEILTEWYHSFVLTYIERDLPTLGLRADPVVLNRFLYMLAHNHGSMLNMSTFARSLGISIPTVSKYAGYFEHGFIMRLLSPWFANVKKRLVKTPKVYLRDSGLLHHLLGIHGLNQIMGHPALGASWEGFVIEQIINSSFRGLSYSFYRTAEGAECDLVITKGTKVLACIEVKFAEAPRSTKSFTTAIHDLKCSNNYIIIPDCKESYQLNDVITVSDLRGFITNHFPNLQT